MPLKRSTNEARHEKSVKETNIPLLKALSNKINSTFVTICQMDKTKYNDLARAIELQISEIALTVTEQIVLSQVSLCHFKHSAPLGVTLLSPVCIL